MDYRRFFTYLTVSIVALSIFPFRALASENLILNPSVETSTNNVPTNWNQGYLWGDLDATYSYLNTGHSGDRSLNVIVSRFSSGDAKWYFNPVTINPGQSYLFSDWYTSSVTSRVLVMFLHSDNHTSYQELSTLAPSSNWVNHQATFIAPTTAISASVFHLISSVGSLTTDDFSLTSQTALAGFNRPLVSITFDDGWQSIHQNALLLLEQHNIKSTQYITTGFVNKLNYMTLSQVRDFHQRGHQIASHTVNHYDLTTLSRKRLITELTQSKLYLERSLGIIVTDLAAPYGAYNATTTTQVKKYYRSQRTSDVGYNTKNNFNTYQLRSQYLTPDVTLTEFQAWLTEARNQKAWLILMYHNVDYSGSAYSVTPEMLNTQLAAVNNSGILVKTIDQALNEITPQL